MVFFFFKNQTLLGKVIRKVTGGNFNHVSILVGDYVYEAHIKTGVTKTHINDYKDLEFVEDYIEIKEDKIKEKPVKKFLDAQVGKKYDVTGALSFISFFAKPKMGYWYCSELGVVSYVKREGASINLEKFKIPPQLFYDILKLNEANR